MILKRMNRRTGDIAEYKAFIWLFEQGFEVFQNVAGDGPADCVIWDKKTNTFTPIDVKTATKYVRKDGSVTYSCPKSENIRNGVKYLLYVKEDDAFMWYEHE